MPAISQLKPEQLRRKLAIVERELANACPELWAERAMLLELIAKAERPANQKYADLVGLPAVTAVLTDTGKWMTRREIFDVLLAGGYPKKDSAAYHTLRDILNKHSANGKLRRDGDRFGLLAWPDTSDTKK